MKAMHCNSVIMGIVAIISYHANLYIGDMVGKKSIRKEVLQRLARLLNQLGFGRPGGQKSNRSNASDVHGPSSMA